MENIFENAHFGKAYKTRDGNKVLLIGFNPFVVALDDINRKGGYYYCVFDDGRINGEKYPYFESKFDVVSEWTEPIDEEELDRLAEEFCDIEYEHPTDLNKQQNGMELGYTNLLNCYKAGCKEMLKRLI